MVMIDSNFSAAVLMYENKIDVIGGAIGSISNAETTSVVAYDFKTNSCETLASLIEARACISAVVYNGQIYVIGGNIGSTANNTVGSGNENNPEPPLPSGDRALLKITLSTGFEKEFDLSMAEVNAFIAWYEAKQAGTGTASYEINKHNNNKGPFVSRKDYVIFDKIITFEVSEYNISN